MYRPLKSKAPTCGVLLTLLALAGCGSSNSTSHTSASVSSSAGTNTQKEPASTGTPSTASVASVQAAQAAKTIPPEITISLDSPTKLKPISALYTCDGSNISLPLAWREVPPHTAELDLFIFTLPGTASHVSDWAVAGLSPTLGKLSAGQLPKGAVVGRNGSGKSRYSICPRKGTSAAYLVHLYALARRLPAKPGFDPNLLRQRIQQSPTSAGLLEFSYKRR
jgi:phosphatidylethanolamine-binding protein (PEBP) family uncharacterized protein